MIKLMLCGCNGKMGKVISRIVSKSEEMAIVCGIDVNTEMSDKFPVFSSPFDFSGDVDAIIDFSHPSALPTLLDYAVKTNTPAVIATTGLANDSIAKINDAAKIVPMFFSFNMSLGVNLIIELAKKAASLLYDNFDIEIIEKHHNQKIDAPSGTAIMIADEINSVLDNTYNYTYDRHSKRQKRSKREIGISTVRGGTIVGEHEIIFAGNDEIVEIKHTAMSKEIFAIGAIKAAKFLVGKKARLYNMSNLVSE